MRYDDIVLGAGHNGLTAAAYLARAGRRVLVLEQADHVGGAAVSARPFDGIDARLSRYSYLVSLLPHRILTDLDLSVRLVRRRYSSYTPDPHDPRRGLLVDTGDAAATAASFAAVTGGPAEHERWTGFYDRMARLASRVFPTVLEPLVSQETMRGLVDDDELWAGLVTRPLAELLEAELSDDTVRGVVATDALIGTFAALDDSAFSQNICFLYHLIGGGSGDWDVPVGGMGSVTDALSAAATAAGATVITDAAVVAVDPDGEVTWHGRDGDRSATTGSLLCGFAPARLNPLLAAGGAEPLRTELSPRGSQLKVNLVLHRLPRLLDASVSSAAAFGGTFHVNEGYRQLAAAHAAAAAGRLPEPLPLEVYCHTLSDRSILGPALAATSAQTLTVFGLHTPVELFRKDNEQMRRAAVDAALRSLASVLAEPLEDVLMTDASGKPCIEARTPVDLERDLGLPGGNIFHRSLQWPWAQSTGEVGSWGVETAYPRLLLCGAGARRGGGVSGIPGHNAAQLLLG